MKNANKIPVVIINASSFICIFPYRHRQYLLSSGCPARPWSAARIRQWAKTMKVIS